MTREGQQKSENLGRSVENGVVRFTSVSQVTNFDPNQYGGCNRRWFIERVLRIKSEQTFSQTQGVESHGQIEHYLRTGEDVLGMNVRHGKRFIPAPLTVAPGLRVEESFGDEKTVLEVDAWRAGQGEREDFTRITKGKLFAAGVPFLGFIDVVNERETWLDDDGEEHPLGPREIELVDWKCTSNIESYGKRADQLADTVQMIGYARWASLVRPDLDRVRVSHGYFQTRGRASSKRSASIPVATVNQRWQGVESTVRAMQDVAREKDYLKVPGKTASCGAYRGCPYQDKCPRSPRETLISLFGKGNTMGLLDRLNAKTKTNPAPTTGGHTTPAGHVAPEAPNAGEVALAKTIAPFVANSAPVTRTDIDAEKEKLKAEEAGKTPPPPVNKAAVVPPDAPASTPPTSAAPIPAGTVLSPAVAEAAKDFAPVVESVVVTAPVTANEAPPAAAPKTRTRKAKEAPVTAPAPASPPPAVEPQDAPAAAEGALDTSPDTEPFEHGPAPIMPSAPIGITLYVDCRVEGIMTLTLDAYINKLTGVLCAQFGAADLRCAPSDSPLGFGKWKGALAALVREKLPPPGNYAINDVRESEFRQVVVEALRPACMVFVRGCV
jgi:hypothetical protein